MRRVAAVTTLILAASLGTALPADATTPDPSDRHVAFHADASAAPSRGSAGLGTRARGRGAASVRTTGVVAVPSRVAVVGATWAEGSGSALRVELREKRDGRWEAWREIGVEDCTDCGAPGRMRAGSDAVTVSGVSHVEMRLIGGADARDARLSVIDASSGDVLTAASVAARPATVGAFAQNAATTTGRTARPARVAVSRRIRTMRRAATFAATRQTTAPTVIGRTTWGAAATAGTRTLRPRGVVVHHTAGTNDYTPEQVPGILRGIQTFHIRDRGWSDIGYNVLVDRFGRAWEGRPGGFTAPHVGAHARGVNGTYLGISYMGDTTAQPATAAGVDTIVDVVGWAANRYGFDATGTLTVGGQTKPVVAGHYQVGDTTCPGVDLTRRLPEIRQRVADQAQAYRAQQ